MVLKEDKAIVLKTHEYGESDLIVSFFSEQTGRWSGIAKGARRSKKRFGPAFEMGAHVNVAYEEKPHRDLAFLKEATLLSLNPKWRTSWETITMASFVLELVTKLSPERQASPQKFLLLENFLRQLQKQDSLSLLLSFQQHWLSLSGWGDNIDCCGICGHVWHNIEKGPKLQTIFDHYWLHLLGRPLVSRGLLEEAFLV